MMRIGCLAVIATMFACASPTQQATAQALEPVAPVAATAATPGHLPPPIQCTPRITGAGAIICRTSPGVLIASNGKPVAKADAEGIAVIGTARTQKGALKISVAQPRDIPFAHDLKLLEVSVALDPRDDPVSRFKMECGKISPQNPADQRHAEIAWVKKDKALKSFNEPRAPVAFAKPADGPYSSPYGAVRTYVPDGDCEGRTSIHNGLDIAVPTGTPIVAPMAGTVILADPDLFYEGGCVFLDHGRGLVSVLMHMSQIDVAAGDVVEQGEQLGLSGSTGRVTGPHLHWAIKYRNVNSDDRGTDIWLDPTLLLRPDPLATQDG